MHATPATTPPTCSTRRPEASSVPPVASRSSTISTRCPGATAPTARCNEFVPYSSSYSNLTVAHGSLPGLRSITNPMPSSTATVDPQINPRASQPAIRSTRCARQKSARSRVVNRRPSPLRQSVDTSRNMIPGLGKSGTSRTSDLMIALSTSETWPSCAATLALELEMELPGGPGGGAAATTTVDGEDVDTNEPGAWSAGPGNAPAKGAGASAKGAEAKGAEPKGAGGKGPCAYDTGVYAVGTYGTPA
eukprot:Amastigsp_a191263_20.p2 type:complete len:248 gc:universal Amastigsp_a191263_20:784-41(-)